jgi:hypothetical protein
MSNSSSSYSRNTSSPYDPPFVSRHLCTPMLTVVYSEIVDIWFKERWLTFAENQKETFLVLDPNITGYLTVQTAIDQRSFVNSKHHLLVPPECLLIRTEPHNKSLVLPNATISFDRLLQKKLRSNDQPSECQLVAILCKTKGANGRFMFYKHLQRNVWYIYFNDPTTSAESYSNMLSLEEQRQLESTVERNNHAAQLTFPLSSLTTHPITYVYVTRKSSW